jgi:hypothetical protein
MSGGGGWDDPAVLLHLKCDRWDWWLLHLSIRCFCIWNDTPTEGGLAHTLECVMAVLEVVAIPGLGMLPIGGVDWPLATCLLVHCSALQGL